MGDIIRLQSRRNKRNMQGTVAREKNNAAMDQDVANIRKNGYAVMDQGIVNANSPIETADNIRHSFTQDSDEPFPVVRYANSLGIDVFVEDFSKLNFNQKVNGYLAIKPRGKTDVIVVNKEESYGHQRWTVAHELWHYLQHKKINISGEVQIFTELGDYLNHDPEECAANQFANELLMPEREFTEIYNLYDEKDKARSALVAYFVVSRTAVERRIADLNL